MIELKTAGELDAMREAGRVVARALEAIRGHIEPGVELRELDDIARSVLHEAQAAPAFLGYHPGWAPSPFPAVICASVNDVIVHGIPGDGRISDGDVVSIDFGAVVDGWCGDAAISVAAGTADAGDGALMEITRQALYDGIAAARPGARIGDVSHAIGIVGRGAGYGIPADLGGHGVGRAMHEAPFVPNDGKPGRGVPLRPGMVIAIEPMFTAGGQDSYEAAEDGWALHTSDGSRAAHAEHTVAITGDGPVVLTVP